MVSAKPQTQDPEFPELCLEVPVSCNCFVLPLPVTRPTSRIRPSRFYILSDSRSNESWVV